MSAVLRDGIERWPDGTVRSRNNAFSLCYNGRPHGYVLSHIPLPPKPRIIRPMARSALPFKRGVGC